MPKKRRRPAMANETPAWIVEALLVEAVLQPTLGVRQLVDQLAARGVAVSKSTVHRILKTNNLSRRGQRLGALAHITAVERGLLAADAVAASPAGFCHWAARPGDLVALDVFYVGNLKGVGRVYQFSAVDTASRWAIADLVVDDKTASAASRFVDLVRARLSELDVELDGVLTDNGPEFVGRIFQDHLAAEGIAHHRIPPRSPNHNAVCERWHQTVLNEFYRPAFHRRRFDRVEDLDRALQTWLCRYNTQRPNHGDFMQGRTPLTVLRSHQP
jgi:transposase InsO family protein